MWLHRRSTIRTTNRKLLRKTNTLLVQTIEIRKTAYKGHIIMRYTKYEQLQLILEGKTDEMRSIECKRKLWLRNIRD